jgi:hypothetical protein
MTTKLTLSVEKGVVEKAKRYAKQHHKSLSHIVTKYLDYLTRDVEPFVDIDAEVSELADEIPIEEFPAVDDLRYQYLKDKYLNA